MIARLVTRGFVALWLALILFAAHALTEKIAANFDDSANLIAEAGR